MGSRDRGRPKRSQREMSLLEWLLVVASGAYAVALFWGLWRMLTS